jgi:hypothetical protein
MTREALAKAFWNAFVALQPNPIDWPSWGELVAQGHQGMHRVNDFYAYADNALAYGRKAVA